MLMNIAKDSMRKEAGFSKVDLKKLPTYDHIKWDLLNGDDNLAAEFISEGYLNKNNRQIFALKKSLQNAKTIKELCNIHNEMINFTMELKKTPKAKTPTAKNVKNK